MTGHKKGAEAVFSAPFSYGNKGDAINQMAESSHRP
jgi:hypothetical protein